MGRFFFLLALGCAAPAAAQPVAIVGGEVHTGTGVAVPAATVLIVDGKITAVGAGLEVPEGAEVISAEGMVVTPGFLDAHTFLGARPVGSREAIAPEVRAADRFAENLAPEWLRSGVTSVYLAPDPRLLIGGTGAVVKLAGPAETAILAEEVAVAASFGESAVGDAPPGAEAPSGRTTRQGMIYDLRNTLVRAGEDAIGGEAGRALGRLLARELPLRMLANKPDDIETALRVAGEFDLRLVLDRAAGAPAVADRLAAAGVPVVVGPSILAIGDGGPMELAGHTPATAAILHAAGVRIALSTFDSRGRSVAMEAIIAWAHGLPREAALTAVTADAALILGGERPDRAPGPRPRRRCRYLGCPPHRHLRPDRGRPRGWRGRLPALAGSGRTMSRRFLMAGAVLAASFPGPLPGAAEHPDPKVQAGITLLDEWIRARMEYSGLPGLVIGITHDQEVVWTKAYGHASLDPEVPMTADSIFRIASHSKLFTAIAVMRLRDAGALRLDDPITDHLPWFDIENRHPEARPVTVRHLLTHTGGLPRESTHPAWTDFEFPEAEAVRDTVSDQETTLRHRDEVEVLEPRVHPSPANGRGSRWRAFLRRARDRRHPRTAGHGFHQRGSRPRRPDGPARHRLRAPDARRQPGELPLRGRARLRSGDRRFFLGPRHAAVPAVADARPRPPRRRGARHEHPARNCSASTGSRPPGTAAGASASRCATPRIAI